MGKGKWKRTIMYYDSAIANRVFKRLKYDGVKVKMTKRKLAVWEQKRHNAKYVYSIHLWRI